MIYDPSMDADDALPKGPAKETLTQKLKRLGIQLGHTLAPDLEMPKGPIEYDSDYTRTLAKKVLAERPFKERLDRIFRGEQPREPGEDG